MNSIQCYYLVSSFLQQWLSLLFSIFISVSHSVLFCLCFLSDLPVISTYFSFCPSFCLVLLPSLLSFCSVPSLTLISLSLVLLSVLSASYIHFSLSLSLSLYLSLSFFYKHVFILVHQTLANRGPNSRFIVEAIFKPLVPKSSRSSIMIAQNCAHVKHKF